MKVFVYGTLKRGEGNNGLLLGCGADFLIEARTKEPRKLVVNGLPYLNRPEIEGGVHVKGEIWEVPEAMIWRLDQLEGHPDWYKRQEDEFLDESGGVWKAWVYYIQSTQEGRAVENYGEPSYSIENDVFSPNYTDY